MTFGVPNWRHTREKYNLRSELWPGHDIWHRHTLRCITSAVRNETALGTLENKRIINVGSGGNDYGIQSVFHVQIDLADRRLNGIDNSIVGTAEHLPFSDSYFDFALCVGSVINYCDAVAALTEISRVLAPKGRLLLEFESSLSAEYIGSGEFGKASVCVQTHFQGESELLWLYHPTYIVKLLSALNLNIIWSDSFHVATAAIYRLTRDERVAMFFAKADRLTVIRRLFGLLACNRIILAEKSL